MEGVFENNESARHCYEAAGFTAYATREFKLDPVYLKGRPQEVKLATCSADKARRLLGYQTKYTLEQGLSEMIAYIEKVIS